MANYVRRTGKPTFSGVTKEMSAKRPRPRTLAFGNVTFVEFGPAEEGLSDDHQAALPAIRDEIYKNRALIRALIDLIAQTVSDPETAVCQVQRSGNGEPSPAHRTEQETSPV